MSSDARDTFLFVIGTRTRVEREDDEPAVDGLWGQRRRSYRVVLEDASETRWVHVQVVQALRERTRWSASASLTFIGDARPGQWTVGR